jgi:hypothetical protein
MTFLDGAAFRRCISPFFANYDRLQKPILAFDSSNMFGSKIVYIKAEFYIVVLDSAGSDICMPVIHASSYIHVKSTSDTNRSCKSS